MYRNTNHECVKELGKENYRAHPGRNRMAILAVILTTILISVVFTVGFVFYQTIYMSENASPGPGCDGNGFYGSLENAEKARSLPQVEWAAYAKRCSARALQNKEFAGINVRLFAPDEVHYEKNMVELISGHYPSKSDEILISDTFAGRFGLSENSVYPIIVGLGEGEESTEKEITFHICGIYKNPLYNIKDVYEEIYTAASFVDIYNPGLAEGYDSIYIKLNNLSFFSFGYDKDTKLSEVEEAAGGNGTFYRMSDTNLIILLPILLLVMLIMLCGYFFIYNIFNISIINDIRFYGELKTVGMTSKQLRKMLFCQIQRIGLWGISIGCVCGYLTGRIAAKVMVPMLMDNIAGYYQPAGAAPVFIMTICFSWLTLYISTMKPFRLAGTISPIEAARFRRKGKKEIFTVLSFLLGSLLFLGVFTLTTGFDINAMVERYNQKDFRIMHNAYIWTLEEPYKPMPGELISQIKNLPGTEDMDIIYRARTKPDFYTAGSRTFYNTSMGEIKKEGRLAEDIRAYNDNQEEFSFGRVKESERGNYALSITGLPARLLNNESKYLEVLEGKLDQEEFATGNYILYQREGDKSRDRSKEVHAGDEVSIAFYDDAADRYVDKTFTIMAVVRDDDMFGTGNIESANLVVTDDVFKDIYSDYDQLAGVLQFNMRDGMEKEQFDTVKGLLEEYGHLQLKFDSKYSSLTSFTEEKRMMRMIGLFLSALLGLIGISNMVNTVVTDVLSRKLEFAAMQSIGMTKKQMVYMIFRQSMLYAGLSLLLSAVFGIPLISAMGQNPLFTGFSFPAFLNGLVILILISILICGLPAVLLTGQLNKLPVAERLREIV